MKAGQRAGFCLKRGCFDAVITSEVIEQWIELTCPGDDWDFCGLFG
ncbi:hypothetical protein QUF90_22500 [Desulfococcaceae bacterium HSG9]|nr:hypothetical protein [Desulfococcaceae bacterium HSG9]